MRLEACTRRAAPPGSRAQWDFSEILTSRQARLWPHVAVHDRAHACAPLRRRRCTYCSTCRYVTRVPAASMDPRFEERQARPERQDADIWTIESLLTYRCPTYRLSTLRLDVRTAAPGARAAGSAHPDINEFEFAGRSTRSQRAAVDMHNA